METETIAKTIEKSANETTNTNSNSEKLLIEQKPIHDTPFTAVKTDDKWFLTMGKYRLTNELSGFNECVGEAHTTNWHRIMQVIQIMITENSNLEHQLQEATKKIQEQEKKSLFTN